MGVRHKAYRFRYCNRRAGRRPSIDMVLLRMHIHILRTTKAADLGRAIAGREDRTGLETNNANNSVITADVKVFSARKS